MTENNKTMVTVFESKDFGKVRTVDIDNKIYFCGSDVAKALGVFKTSGRNNISL